MPTRVWVWIGGMIGAAVVAVAVLMIAVPEPAIRERNVVAVNPAEPAAPNAGQPAAAPRPAAGRVAPAPELIADVAALAADLQAGVPATHVPVLGGPTTLTLVSAAAQQLTFAYEVELDIQDYPVPPSPVVLFPGLSAEACEAGATRPCYVFAEQFIVDICQKAKVRPLIDRGAIVRYLFQDLNRRFLTSLSVRADDCDAPGALAGLGPQPEQR